MTSWMRGALVGLTVVALAQSAAAAPPRHRVGHSTVMVPYAIDVPFAKTMSRLLVGAALDTRPIVDVLRQRYASSAKVREFRQGRPTVLGTEDGRPTFARAFGVDLRIDLKNSAAQMALDAKQVDVRLAGRLVARQLGADGGCPSGELAFGVALVVFQSPQRVRDEFAGFAIRMCVLPQEKRQCIVHALPDRTIETCYPDVAPSEFDKHVCNRAYLDKKRGMMTVPGSVACYRRWGTARVNWDFDVLDGERPTSWYRGVVDAGMRIFGASAVKLIVDRYSARWGQRYPIVQGSVVP